MVELANVGARVMAAGGDIVTADQILDTDPHSEDGELVWVLVRR